MPLVHSEAQSRRARSVVAGLGLATVLVVAGLLAAATAAASGTPACLATQLSARIVNWEGAAGSRIANVRLVNTSFTSCYVRNFPRVRLVSATGATLIGGSAASTTASTHTIAPLHLLLTEVSDSNYCGHSFMAPATLTFTLTGSLGRVVAIPVSSSDTSGVPPCNGAPGSAGHISMHAWHT
jgi:Protein of unknown function (DUF4232)